MGHPCPHPASFLQHTIKPLSLDLSARMSRSVCLVEVPCKQSSIRANRLRICVGAHAVGYAVRDKVTRRAPTRHPKWR